MPILSRLHAKRRDRYSSRRSTIESLEPRLVLDSTVVFNEIMYNPAGLDDGLEWIELYNQMAIDMDISEWSLEGGVDFDFPDGTVVPGRGYLVIAADPDMLAGTSALAWTSGSLSNQGEELRLVNNSGRLMNRVDYNDNDPWPVGPDGSGVTLAKQDENTDAEQARNWTSSTQVGGTPGEINFPELDSNEPQFVTLLQNGAPARVLVPTQANELAADWNTLAFDDAADPNWLSRNTGIGFDTLGASAVSDAIDSNGDIQSQMAGVNASAFVRSEFTVVDPAQLEQLVYEVDYNDGFVAYLNGTEVARRGAPQGPLAFDATALQPSADYASFVQNLNPAGYYRLNETTVGTVVDSSGNNRDATHSAGVLSGELNQTPGALDPVGGDSSLRASGSAVDLAGVESTVLVSGSQDFSLSIWVNPDSFGGGDFGTFFFMGAPASGQGLILAEDGVAGTGRIRTGRFGSDFGPNGGTGSLALNPGQWNNVGVTYDAGLSEFKLFVNGQLDFTTVAALDIGSGGSRLGGLTSTAQPFGGGIDEFAFFRETLSDDQMLALADITSTGAVVAGTVRSETIDLTAFLGDLNTGTNLLAIQGLSTSTTDTDFLIRPRILARESLQTGTAEGQVVLNEIASALDAEFRVELTNIGEQSIDLGGYVLLATGAAGGQFTLGTQILAPGDFLDLTQTQTGLDAADGEKLFLFKPGQTELADARRVTNRLRGRSPQHEGRWLYPDLPTPGAANSFDISNDVVINEIMFQDRPNFGTSDTPATFETTTLLPLSVTSSTEILIGSGTQGRVLIPTQAGELPADWTAPAFDDSAWLERTNGIGFDTTGSSDVAAQIDPSGDIQSQMSGVNASAFVRLPFELDDPSLIETLSLDLDTNDGYVAYLNGVEIARRNAPEGTLPFDAAAELAGAGNETYEELVNSLGPSVYYRFNETTSGTVFDSSGNGNDAVHVGGATVNDANGAIAGDAALGTNGYAVNLAGIEAAALVTGSQDFSVSIWANPDSFSGNPRDFGTFFYMGPGTGSLTSLILAEDGVGGTGLVRPGRWANDFGPDGGAGTIPMLVNEWNHIGATYDSTTETFTLYVNGQLDFSTNITLNIQPGGSSLGSLGQGAGQNFDGMIDEFAFFQKILTSEEMFSLADPSSTGTGDTTGVVSHTTINLSGNLNDLVSGTNVLAIQGLNSAADNPDFLIRAELESTTLEGASSWRYNESGSDLAATWALAAHPQDDTNWFSGPGPLGFETTPQALPVALNTELADPQTNVPFVTTYYFETEFEFSGSLDQVDLLQLQTMIDDGAVFYLNGQEVYRMNMAGNTGDPVSADTFSSAVVGNAAIATVSIPTAALVVGTNRLSVEVHQRGLGSSDIVMGAGLLAQRQLTAVIAGEPFSDSNEEWIELYNRSSTAVDLTGWSIRDAVSFDFAPGTTIAPGGYLVVANDSAALSAQYPGIDIVGDFSGKLSNQSDRIVLRDDRRNPADEVEYFEGGRWPSAADGGGSTLELRDPDADNSKAEAWAASDESGRSAWNSYSFRRIAAADTGPTIWNEFLFGLLDSGEVLIDDVSVRQDPGGANIELIQNGTFEADTIGGEAAAWRIIGTHQGTVIDDADNSGGNKVLRVVASARTRQQHDNAGTTLAGNVAVIDGTEYEISFRAKWISGSPLLNTRLYFTRVAETITLRQPEQSGTPGAANSTLESNLGPTYSGFSHTPAVPENLEPVTVQVAAQDPDSVSAMTLYWSAGGGAFSTVAMTTAGDGLYRGTIPGQNAGTVVQFYVEGEDALGAVSTFPAAGADSRALYQVDAGQGTSRPVDTVQIVMLASDVAELSRSENLLSNKFYGATVIVNSQQVFYDVEARQKGSIFGRADGSVDTSYRINFDPDQLFRGVHDKIALDASGRSGLLFNSQDEILNKQLINRAGGITSIYDDLAYMIGPAGSPSGPIIIQQARYDSVYLDEQFEGGSDSPLFEFEGIPFSTRTLDGNPESLKDGTAIGFINQDIADLGDSKEDYRWRFELKNNRDRDDYDRIIEMAKAFELTGQALEDTISEIIDVDQWMRTFAMMSLQGVFDVYTVLSTQNIMLYVRPEDNKVMLFPWDWDQSWWNPVDAPLHGEAHPNMTKIFDLPANERVQMGHLLDIINTTFNTDYMTSWAASFGSLVGQNYAPHLNYIQQRGDFVLSQLPAQIPFQISTPDPLDVGAASTATIEGKGWINVREIRLAGSDQPLDVSWRVGAGADYAETWAVAVPVDQSTGTVTLEAYDFQGNLINTGEIVVSSTASRSIVDQLRVTEIMYNPDGDDAAEFIELMNTGSDPIPSLQGVAFTAGIEFTFPDVPLAAGERIVVVRDTVGFEAVYAANVNVAGTYAGSALSNSGEQIVLVDSDGVLIQDFVYDDTGSGWHPSTDGDGFSLVIVDATGDRANWNDPAGWRPSFESGGSPGAIDLMQGDINQDNRVGLIDLALRQSNFDAASATTRADLTVLLRNFGRSYSPPAASPEASAAAPDSLLAAISGAGSHRPSTSPTRPTDISQANNLTAGGNRPYRLRNQSPLRTTLRRLKPTAVDAVLVDAVLTETSLAREQTDVTRETTQRRLARRSMLALHHRSAFSADEKTDL